MAKSLTREKAERKKEQAAAFMDRIGQPDRADEFRGMSVDEYAAGKGIRLTNPQRSRTMAQTAATTKADLQDQMDRAIEVLDDAYTPEASREELAQAIGQALDILRGEDEEPEEEDEDEPAEEEDEDDDLD